MAGEMSNGVSIIMFSIEHAKLRGISIHASFVLLQTLTPYLQSQVLVLFMVSISAVCIVSSSVSISIIVIMISIVICIICSSSSSSSSNISQWAGAEDYTPAFTKANFHWKVSANV